MDDLDDLLNDLESAGLGGGEAQGKSLLDVATGPGYSAGLAAARGASATGIDFAAAMAAKAATLFPAGTFRQGDAEALPQPLPPPLWSLALALPARRSAA